jgi:hypothetical protein
VVDSVHFIDEIWPSQHSKASLALSRDAHVQRTNLARLDSITCTRSLR